MSNTQPDHKWFKPSEYLPEEECPHLSKSFAIEMMEAYKATGTTLNKCLCSLSSTSCMCDNIEAKNYSKATIGDIYNEIKSQSK